MITLFVIEVGIDVTIPVSLVTPRVRLVAVTVVSSESVDVDGGAAVRRVDLGNKMKT